MKYKDYIKLGLVGLVTVTALCVGGCGYSNDGQVLNNTSATIVTDNPVSDTQTAPQSVSNDEVVVVPTESTETHGNKAFRVFSGSI